MGFKVIQGVYRSHDNEKDVISVADWYYSGTNGDVTVFESDMIKFKVVIACAVTWLFLAMPSYAMQDDQKKSPPINKSQAAERAKQQVNGRVLRVEQTKNKYRVKVLKKSGRVVSVDVDRNSGRVNKPKSEDKWPQMRILLAEDDSRLLTQLDTLLQQNGYSVDLADTGTHALFQITEHPYDLAIIDVGLPKMDGFDVIRQARKQDVKSPVLILTARDRWQEKVEGLDAGADDYLTKPFHNEELLARIKALIRRSSGQANPTISLGPISLDTVSEQVKLNDALLELTAYEYKVLEYLLMNPNKIISKTQLTEHIYDQDFDLDSNVIEVFVGRLRKKLDPDGTLKPIETLRGRGYRINPSLWPAGRCG